MSGLTEHLRRFRSGLPARLAQWSRELTAAHLVTGVDPLLLAAIMDRESLGGDALKPPKPFGTGDRGHGRGLMQIDDRSHAGFVNATEDGGMHLWKRPAMNVLYAAQLLERNLAAFDQNEDAAVAAYNAGAGRVRRVLMGLGPTHTLPDRRRALDLLTTGHDYVSDVFRRRLTFIPPAT